MTADQNNALSVQPFSNSPMVSLRERSSLTLQAAIHGDSDEGETLKRVNAVLALYFDPDNDQVTRAGIREEFVRALAGRPQWAVQRAFDAWTRTASRRPTPGEIVMLCDRELKPISEELSRRRKLEEDAKAAQEDAARNRVSAETAARIMAEKGMTPERLAAVRRFPTATSTEAIDQMGAPKPLHDWSQGLPDDDPRMIALRKSRAESHVVKF